MELEWFENYPWGRVAFKVLMNSGKGRDISGCYTIKGFAQALQVWVYTALPELDANYGNPLPNNPFPPILAYKGRKGRRQFKEAILSQLEDFPEDLIISRLRSLFFPSFLIRQISKFISSICTAKVIIPNKKLYPGYNPFAPIDKKKTLKNHHIDAWINVLRKRYDANPQHFKSERMCFLDHLFAQQWRFNYKDFKDPEHDQNGLRRRLSGGAWNYYAGTIPSFY
ncbi:unnamed protein product [Brassica oleracea]